MKLDFPYGKGVLSYDFEEKGLSVLSSPIGGYAPEAGAEELIRRAMAAPVGSPVLSELAKGKKKITIIISDHTRPVPSRLILPPMLREIWKGSPEAEITLLVATGCHRGTTAEELRDKCGDEIVDSVRIVVHDCDDRDNMVYLGPLPSGGRCEVHRLAAEADLLLAEGFIEPHFFAGFSGGRKSVLPGVASRATVLANHCSAFIQDPRSRTGVLDGNPIHRDMLWAAEKAGLAYIVNVVLNEDKKVIYAVAGNVKEAHEKGAAFLSSLCRVKSPRADLAISTNGGYPLDQNLYQSVKGMTAAESAVREGGVILMLCSAADGIGGKHFYEQMALPDPEKTLAEFLSRGPEQTEPDQWMTQIFLRILKKARVILVSEVEDEVVRSMHMIPAHSLEEGLKMAKEILGTPSPSIAAIPDGVSVIVEEER